MINIHYLIYLLSLITQKHKANIGQCCTSQSIQNRTTTKLNEYKPKLNNKIKKRINKYNKTKQKSYIYTLGQLDQFEKL